MKKPCGTILAILSLSLNILCLPMISVATGAGGEVVTWSVHSELPPPSGESVQPGLAGVFAGVAGGSMVIAGGANFPDKPPWKGGVKTWWDHIYVYHPAAEGWEVINQKLPAPLAYGVSVCLPDGLLCIGGCNQDGPVADVFLIRISNGKAVTENWPSLPEPLAFAAGALVDGKIYIAGGEGTDKAAGKSFYVLDTRNRDKGWFQLPPWPGPARAFAVAAGQSDGFDNCFYLFSGRNYGEGRELDVLDDGFCYNPRTNTWIRLDQPTGPRFPVMAGAALPSGANHIIFLGGSDGQHMVAEEKLRKKIEIFKANGVPSSLKDSVSLLESHLVQMMEGHPGFSRELRVYHSVTNTLYTAGVAPDMIPVTTEAFRYGNEIILPLGETRPGIRSPRIWAIGIQPSVRAFGWLNSLVVFLYFAVLVGMGVYFSRRQKTSNDYFRGGGRLPWWAVGLSIFGTGLSAITFMAIPAKSFATDWSYILLNAGIVMVAPVIVFLFIPFFRKLDLTTAYEYLEQRFNLTTRLVCSLAFILFQVGRMGIVLFLPSIALNVATGIDIFLCIALMGVFSLVYTMMGGIEAVIWTDALQVVVLMGGAALAVFFIGSDVQGGLPAIISTAAADGKFHLANSAFDLKNPTLWTVLIASVFTNITTYGADQTMVQRYLSTHDEKSARRSVWTNALLVVPASLIFFFVGTALFVFYKEHPASLNMTLNDGDAIFPSFIFNRMPPGVSGLLISGIFAAAMSTLSSSMNSAATAWSVDFHFRFGRANDNRRLKVARTATLIAGTLGILFAVMMATWDIKSLWDEFNKILGLVMGALGGLFLLGITTRKANGTGALAGIAGSMAIQLWVMKAQPVHLLLYATTGFISCFLIGYAVSIITGGNHKEIGHLTIYKQNIYHPKR